MRSDTGMGLVDVVVATGLFGTLALSLAVLLAGVSRAQLAAGTERYAAVVAQDVLAQAEAYGCGAASGYGSAAQAQVLATQCTWGTSDVQSLGDVLLADPTDGTLSCPASLSGGVPGPACYQVPGTATELSVGLSFAWSWSTNQPDLSSLANGQAVAAPPDELVSSVQVDWPSLGPAGEAHQLTQRRVEAPPGVLTTAWDAGGMGMVAVDVAGNAPTPVGLVVPGWASADPPVPAIVSVSQPSAAGNWAVFGYVPATDGYQAWGGTAGNLSPTFSVAPGDWAVVQISAGTS